MALRQVRMRRLRTALLLAAMSVLSVAVWATSARAASARPLDRSPSATGIAITTRSRTSRSARWPLRGKIVAETFNAFSVLRTVEDLLAYKPLAGARTARSFAALIS
jgi:predicted metal-binding membrane protein